MNKEQAKAEAEKIIQEFYEQIPERVFETSLDYEVLHKWCVKASIIQVKGIIKESFKYGEDLRRWKHWQSILTHLQS